MVLSSSLPKRHQKSETYMLRRGLAEQHLQGSVFRPRGSFTVYYFDMEAKTLCFLIFSVSKSIYSDHPHTGEKMVQEKG